MKDCGEKAKEKYGPAAYGHLAHIDSTEAFDLMLEIRPAEMMCIGARILASNLPINDLPVFTSLCGERDS